MGTMPHLGGGGATTFSTTSVRTGGDKIVVAGHGCGVHRAHNAARVQLLLHSWRARIGAQVPTGDGTILIAGEDELEIAVNHGTDGADLTTGGW